MKILKNKYIQFIILGLILSLLPLLSSVGIFPSSYVVTFGTTLIYAIVALGLNVLLGTSGLISLGTAGFMGLAAYMSAYLFNSLNLPFELSFLLSVIVPTILGIIVGLISLKLAGLYLGIATLAVAEVLREVFIQFDAFTGGSSGANSTYPTLLGFIQLKQNGTYIFIVVVMIVVFIVVHNLMKGHLGRALNSMRGSEAAAQAMGVNIFKYKLIAFGIATALASIGGVLYVHFIRLSYPTMWQLNLSLDFLAIIVIGGLRSIFGTLSGAFIVYTFTEIVFKPVEVLSSISPIFKGLLMILCILFYPNGFVGIFNDIKRLFQKKNQKELKKEGD
ncbi:MAG: branched-chain amino acid ABC transporter permease [Tissierellia bacterium]|nr:branched-chain amino acid ABC transporter permease [Tissierellia bacterium]